MRELKNNASAGTEDWLGSFGESLRQVALQVAESVQDALKLPSLKEIREVIGALREGCQPAMVTVVPSDRRQRIRQI